jgi:3-oxoacyl-[acyl-carrier protein] reductase
MSILNNKIAVVTGGSRGIGKAISLSLAEAGADVLLLYRQSGSGADSVVAQITGMGRRSRAYQADVSIHAEAKQIVEAILADYGRIDILVNNAGITRDGLLLRMSEEDWDAVIATNLKSVFNMSKAAVKPMMTQRNGKIINITSIAGVIGNAGQTNYASSKASMIGFTKSLAREVASRNIQVNAVAPGFIDTAMTGALNEEQRKRLLDTIPLKRMGRPDEIGTAVRFLASAEADYITGQVICVDGGMVM